jgi:hypothetical protein
MMRCTAVAGQATAGAAAAAAAQLGMLEAANLAFYA